MLYTISVPELVQDLCRSICKNLLLSIEESKLHHWVPNHTTLSPGFTKKTKYVKMYNTPTNFHTSKGARRTVFVLPCCLMQSIDKHKFLTQQQVHFAMTNPQGLSRNHLEVRVHPVSTTNYSKTLNHSLQNSFTRNLQFVLERIQIRHDRIPKQENHKLKCGTMRE